MSTTNDIPAMPEIDKEMTPFLAELVTLGPGNNEHKVIKHLFSWLVDPMRTGEEFHYLIGPLKHRVDQTRTIHFRQFYFEEYADENAYMFKLAAEALAIKCPVLTGPWSQAAWQIVLENYDYNINAYGAASNQLSAWIIQVIGDPNLCPEALLRLNLMSLLYKMVNLNDDNRAQAFESVMSACSFANIENVWDHNFASMVTITKTFERLAEDEYLIKVDEKLADMLYDIKTSRLNSLVHDVAYNSAVNPNSYAKPMALHGLTALLRTVAEYVRTDYKYDQCNDGGANGKYILTVIEDTIPFLRVLLSNFKKTCRTPQLRGLTYYMMSIIDLATYKSAVNPNIFATTFQERLDNIDSFTNNTLYEA